MSGSTLTVESALNELQTMFGRKWREISVGTSHDGLYYKVKVYGKPILPAMSSLEEALTQVRQWHEGNKS